MDIKHMSIFLLIKLNNMNGVGEIVFLFLVFIKTISILLLIITIIVFILFSIGIYLIASKLCKNKCKIYEYLSFIPILQLYVLAKIAGKGFFSHFIFPLLFIYISIKVSTSGILDKGGYEFISLLLTPVSVLVLLLTTSSVYYNISKKIGKGFGTTIGFILIPYIMLPIVGYKLEKTTLDKKINNND